MARTTENLKGEKEMNTIMNIDPWGFLDDLLGVPSRTFQAMRARAAGRFPPVNVFLDDNAVLLGAPVELVGTTLGASLHEDFKLTPFTAPIALGTEFVL